MSLNMREFCRLAKRRDIPIQIPQPLMQMRITAPDVPDIGLEMLHVDSIEANYGREEPYIRFGDVLSEIKGPFGGCEVFLGAIKGGEELHDGFGVCFFGGGEAGSVDTVIDVWVDPLVRGFDLSLQICRKEDYVPVLFWQ